MNRLTVLQRIIDKTNATNYLEIGVQKGKIISKIKAPNKIGVDPKFIFTLRVKFEKLFRLTKFKTFEVTSDTFFEKYAEKTLKKGIDVALVDGLHTYHQSLKDVKNCIKYLNDDGVIVMHDCNPLHAAGAYPVKESIKEVLALAKKGEVPGWNGNWNGDVWKAIAHLQVENNDLEVFTLDLDYGLGIVTKGRKSKKLEGITVQDIESADYSFLEKNRAELLNLKHPKYLEEFLDGLPNIQ